jgi:hypothetical protein
MTPCEKSGLNHFPGNRAGARTDAVRTSLVRQKLSRPCIYIERWIFEATRWVSPPAGTFKLEVTELDD